MTTKDMDTFQGDAASSASQQAPHSSGIAKEDNRAENSTKRKASDPLADIQPAYFYPIDAFAHENQQDSGSESDASSDASSSKNLSPESQSLRGVPVFTPTMEQFSDFYAFCQAIDKWGMQSGIVKVIPPKEWTDGLPSLGADQPNTPDTARIDRIRIKNAITQHFLSAGPGRWKQTNVTRAKAYDAKQWADLCRSPAMRGPPMCRIQAKAQAALDAEQATTQSRSYTPVAAPVQVAPRLPPASSPSANSTASTKSAPTSVEQWQSFDYQSDWTREAQAKEDTRPPSPNQWNPATCRAIEAEYWRSLNFGKPPMYGADLQGTLFDERTKLWNVGTLDSLLSRRLQHALPGVTTPYLYFGMWRASFAWHVEDMDLNSINYIHFGAPKQWYSIRQADRKRFESIMASSFSADSAKCPHFMRHKSFLASPKFLSSQGIRPLRLVQHAREFVLTFPHGYHAGYNLGFNCAESVNFALPSWIDIGRNADYCRCDLAQESVHFDLDMFLDAEQKVLKHAPESHTKSKRSKQDKAPIPIQASATSAASHCYDCLFCVSPAEPTMLQVPRDTVKALRRSLPAKKILEATRPIDSQVRVHALCASFIPETWPSADEVCGVQEIERARWQLKCQLCTDAADARHGAKVQCTRGKCPRAAHVGCALREDSGWLLDMVSESEADQLEGRSLKKNQQQKPASPVSLPPTSIVHAKSTVNDSVKQDPSTLANLSSFSDPTEQKLSSMDKEASLSELSANDSLLDSNQPSAAPERLVVLCRQHNPLYQQQELAKREASLLAAVEKLEIGQAIGVKAGSGIWMTRLRALDRSSQHVYVDASAEDPQAGMLRIPWTKLHFDTTPTSNTTTGQTKTEAFVLECKVPVRRAGMKEPLSSDTHAQAA
ncbi:hypothetical protein MYAM1_002793 [Malassezia yamatoensis]|uniref:[histone H3]-trimethyl-L-lysine(9) demethylase n=1 Tax=Malassezia yamatoensis TaxID=253288 RepID=A0AAJ6CJR2_9BASI|nr:hypothetical protein MYAM1_002793 [Malassezia yamatoensis]